MDTPRYKNPRSVLVVIYTPQCEVLLLRRVQDAPDGQAFWQSVTGSQDDDDASWQATAVREVREETGIVCGPGVPGACLQDWHLENVYPIYPQWLHRYAPGVWSNVEHVFGLCVPSQLTVQLSVREHSDYCWLDWRQAADKCFSASNAEAVLLVPRMHGALASNGSPR